MRAKHAVSMLLTLLLISSAIGLDIAFLASRAFAPIGGSNPTLWVLPPVNVYDKNSPPFRVTIYLNDTKNPIGPLSVSAWALTLAYDPSILSIYNITEGPYLKSSGSSTLFSSNSVPGGVSMGDVVTSTSAAASGPGDLVYVWFNVVGNGKVNFVLSSVQLLDLNGGSLTMGPSQNGVFYTTYPKAYFYYLPSKIAPSLLWIPNYTRRDPVLGDDIVFNASAFTLGIGYGGSYDPDGGTVANYRWDFGDGNITSPSWNYSVITHSYATVGSYHVVLNVTDNEVKTDTYFTDVSVTKHEVAVTEIQVSPTKASPGQDVSIKVTIKNQGTYSGTEYVNVTLFYNTTLIWYNTTSTPGIGKKSAWSNVLEYDPVSKTQPMNFLVDQSITINYTWATSGVPLGNYTIWANISLVDQSADYFLKDLYHKELDFNLTNNEKTWSGMINFAQFHNLVVTDITVSPVLNPLRSPSTPPAISNGATAVTIDVTIKNFGVYNETFYLTLYQNSTLLMNWTSITLLNGTMVIEEYTWNASSLPIGHYSINATASNSNTTGQLILPIIITMRPSVVITYSPSKPTIQDVVQFDASGSQAAPGWNITQYSWKVNGTDDSGMNLGLAKPGKTFFDRGAYNISLTVTDSVGVTGTGSILIYVGITPAASFVVSPSTPKVDQTITFDASTSAADNKPSQSGSDSLIEYDWNFGDGSKLVFVGQNVTKSTTHSFTKSSNFTVTLTVFDTEGLNGTTTKYVFVSKITSTVTLTLNKQTIKINENVTISGQVTPSRSGVKVTISYQLGSGAWTQLPILTSDQSGRYTYLWVINTAGNYTVKTQISGDDKYTSAESQPSTIQVQAAQNPPPPTPLDLTPYFVAGIVIIVVIGAAVYVMRKRRK